MRDLEDGHSAIVTHFVAALNYREYTRIDANQSCSLSFPRL
jgi:hypothetical protein